MFGRVLQILRQVLRLGHLSNGKEGPLALLNVLLASYYRLSRLARQLEEYAARAPYPHVAERLRRLSSEKQRSAHLLKGKIESLNGEINTDAPPESSAGKNHWERMTQGLKQQKDLEDFLTVHSMRLAEEAPQIADLLGNLVTMEAGHRRILQELAARADPQADQT